MCFKHLIISLLFIMALSAQTYAQNQSYWQPVSWGAHNTGFNNSTTGTGGTTVVTADLIENEVEASVERIEATILDCAQSVSLDNPIDFIQKWETFVRLKDTWEGGGITNKMGLPAGGEASTVPDEELINGAGQVVGSRWTPDINILNIENNFSPDGNGGANWKGMSDNASLDRLGAALMHEACHSLGLESTTLAGPNGVWDHATEQDWCNLLQSEIDCSYCEIQLLECQKALYYLPWSLDLPVLCSKQDVLWDFIYENIAEGGLVCDFTFPFPQ